MYKKNIVLPLLVILLLLVRLGTLLFLSKMEMIINDDELFYGAVAKEIINDQNLKLFDYQIRPWEGGGLIVSVLASFFFRLFGDSLFSLKLVGVLFSLGILIVLFLILEQYFNRQAAIIASLLFIFPPALLGQRSLMVFGNHFESLFFNLLVTLIFFRIFYQDNKSNYNSRSFFFLGLLSGFASYFCYTFLITLITCLLFYSVSKRNYIFKKEFLILLGSFLLGFSPWIYYNLTHNFLGIIVKDKPIMSHFLAFGPWYFLIKLKNFLFFDIFSALGIEGVDIMFNRISSFVYYGTFVSAFCYLFWANRKSIGRFILGLNPLGHYEISPKEISKETFFLAYFFIFTLIYALADFTFYDARIFKSYKHIIPLLPHIFIIISIFFSRLIIKKYKHALFSAFSVMLILIFSGFISISRIISFANFCGLLKYKGYSYTKFGYLLGMKFDGKDIKKHIELINRFPSDNYRSDCYYGLGKKLVYIYGAKIESILPVIDKVDEKYLAYCYYGAGEEIGKSIEGKISTFRNIIENFKKINKKYQPYIIEGLGVTMDWIIRQNQDINQLTKIINGLGKDYPRYFYKGLISGYSGDIAYDKYIGFINKFPQEYQATLYEALGVGISDAFLFDDFNRAISLIEKVKAEYRGNCYEGCGVEIANVIGDDMNKCIFLINKIKKERRPYCYRGLKMAKEGKKFCKLGFKTELLIFTNGPK